ncbi:uncharacterized protein V6R79_001575 [Siganus canaliculatus]
MDDEGADDVFIPKPPSYAAPLLPAEGSNTGTMVNNPIMTPVQWPADASEAVANPNGLDWHHSEQLMATHSKVDEVKAGTVKTSEESTDTKNTKEPAPSKELHQNRASMEDTGNRMEEELNAEVAEVLSGGQENWKETGAERVLPKETPSSTQELTSRLDIAETTGDKCGFAETVPNPKTDNDNCDNAETPTRSGLIANDELHECSHNRKEMATNQPQVAHVPTEDTSSDSHHVNPTSLDYNTTKSEGPQRATEEGFEKIATTQEEGGGKRISTDIQQGEQLLQRLHQVQLRQDEYSPDSPDTPKNSQMIVQEGRAEFGIEGVDLKEREGNLTDEDETEEENEGNVYESKAKMSMSEPDCHMTARTEANVSDDDDSTPQDLSPVDHHERSHRLSAAETSLEKQIQEAVQEKQKLQRAGGLFNLADNPDVLEIPFKTNITLEPLANTGQRQDWQFSEQKMQKEISQEIQRELVLVNQGKIPGGYSKGESRQLKETKLLFETFQQDNSGGPTRHRKSPTSLLKSHVYPSVLERTRSLENFSLKSRPIFRAQSLRLHKSTSEREKSPEDFRAKSPTSFTRDKSRLSPYTKQDKDIRLHRSMDSISADASLVEMGNKARQGRVTQESPILKHNPFYKLRPALALQPEVEKDIREAKKREEELRRQRCTLYGENRQNSEDGEKSQPTPALTSDVRKQSRGKLERVWPPPSKKDQTKSESQPESKVHRAAVQKTPLFQRWESGQVNGQRSEEKN